MPLLNEVSTGALGDDQDKKIESLVKQINEQNRLISNEDRTKIIKDSSGTPRILFGEGPNQFYGLKVSQEGNDVTGATDSQLVFNSDNNVFKIVASGTASQPVTSLAQDATNTVTVAHNLGYIPTAIIYLNGTGSTYLTANRYYVPPISVPVKVGATYYPGVIHSYNIDSTNIYFTVTNSSAATPITDIGTVNWKYYLLQETAN